MKRIGKVVATEKMPTTVDEFYFWTDKKRVIKPFDVVKVEHIRNSVTFGVVEEISHFTDSPGFLAGYISSDFGDVEHVPNTERIGMNYVKARVVGNTDGIFTPVLDGHIVSFADENDVKRALGLDEIKNPLPCGYIEMYEPPDSIRIPVHFNSHFLIGPEGAHLNISGISGLASKTSYAMFLLKAIQNEHLQSNSDKESVAFVILNVKGRDLVAIDEPNGDLTKADKEIYEMLKLSPKPFANVKYFYPYSKQFPTTYARPDDVKNQQKQNKAFQFKYIFEDDKESIDLLFSNVDDPNQTMESIVNYISTGQGKFDGITNWNELLNEIHEHTKKGDTSGRDREITVSSWRKFYRLFRKTLDKSSIFANGLGKGEVRLQEQIKNIQKNEVFVIDVARLDEETQGFVFGDVMRAVYDLKLGQIERKESDIPNKIIVFIDELNKYASKDVPKNSPILRQIMDITERGRSLGIILFGAEQFRSDIHDRVKGNCASYAYGRTNAIEVSKSDYQYVPAVYKSMLTRLKQGEYIIQNPVFRSLLSIKFPKPIYKQFKNG
ncbi:MAG TPA: ATP-binding protein [Chitinophagales bacterium]|nr:ATP-binding protein [Chitinophagales bacterium]